MCKGILFTFFFNHIFAFLFIVLAKLAGLRLSSQLLSDLKRSSSVNKSSYKLKFSPSEEELLKFLDAAREETALGIRNCFIDSHFVL